MYKPNRELLVPRIIIFLTFVISSLRVFSIISSDQALFLLVINIALAIILSKLQSNFKRRKEKI